MPKLGLFIIFVVSFASGSCGKVANSYDPLTMECGEFSVPFEGLRVQVEGQSVDSMSALIRSGDEDPLHLEVSNKGCVAIPASIDPHAELLLFSKQQGRILGEHLSVATVRELKSLRLRDLTAYRPEISCRAVSQVNGTLHVQKDLEWQASVTSPQDDPFPSSRHFEFFYKVTGDGRLIGLRDVFEKISLTSLVDGHYDIIVEARLKTFPEIKFTKICSIVKDAEAPRIELNSSGNVFYPDLSKDIIQALPGESLILHVQDKSPTMISSCWRKLSASQECEYESNLNSAVTTPSNGEWILQVKAIDASGNRHELHMPIVIFEKDKANAIEQSSLSAQLLAESKRWMDGLKLIVKTTNDWLSLTRHELVSGTAAKIRSAFLQIYFSRKPVLIEFETKGNVNYLGNAKFLYLERASGITDEKLVFKIYDFSSEETKDQTRFMQRPLGLDRPEIFHDNSGKAGINVRTGVRSWSIFDEKFNEIKRIELAEQVKVESLTYFHESGAAVAVVNGKALFVDSSGLLISKPYSDYDATDIAFDRDLNIVVYEKGQTIWDVDGRLLWSGVELQKKLRWVSGTGPGKLRHLLAYSCGLDSTCTVDFLRREGLKLKELGGIKVPYRFARLSATNDGRLILMSEDDLRMTACETSTGRCTSTDFTSKIIDVCYEKASQQLSIVTYDSFYTGNDLESLKFHNFDQTECFETGRGFGYHSGNITTTFFEGKWHRYEGRVEFTPDGRFMQESGLNVSRVLVSDAERALYNRTAARTESMIRKIRGFSKSGRYYYSLGDYITILDTSSGQRLTNLEDIVEQQVAPVALLPTDKDDEIFVSFRSKISRFNIYQGTESVFFSSKDHILSVVPYDQFYLVLTVSSLVTLNKNGEEVSSAPYTTPPEHGFALCTEFSKAKEMFFMLDIYGSLVATSRDGQVKSSRLPIPERFDGLGMTDCQLRWNDQSQSLFIAIDSSIVWEWKPEQADPPVILTSSLVGMVDTIAVTRQGKVLVIPVDMTQDQLKVYDPKVEQFSSFGLGIDLRGGWFDQASNTAYAVGYDGEIVAFDADFGGQDSIYWRGQVDYSLNGVVVAPGESAIVLEAYDQILSSSISIQALLERACQWLAHSGSADGSNCRTAAR